MAGQDNHAKWISIIIGLIILLLTWMANTVSNIHEGMDKKADKTDTRDRWTGKQQEEYRQNIDNQLDYLNNEVDRLRKKK